MLDPAIRHPNSSNVTIKLSGLRTSTCGFNNNQYDLFRKSSCHVTYRRRMPGTLVWQRQSLGDPCQIGKMATADTVEFIIFRVQNFVSA